MKQLNFYQTRREYEGKIIPLTDAVFCDQEYLDGFSRVINIAIQNELFPGYYHSANSSRVEK